ncbi:MAG: glycosyltransferase family 4 protein [Nitrospiria bacterium]
MANPSTIMLKTVVIHIITKLELGGAQQNTLYTVTHLNPDQFETYLICGKGGILDREASILGDQLFFIPDLKREIHPFYDVIALFKTINILKKLRRKHPDAPIVVHTHSSKGGILGRIAAYMAGVQVIVHTYHGFGFHDFQKKWLQKLYIFLEKLTGKITRQLIFVSKDNARRASELGLVKNSPLIIRSGISFHNFKETISGSSGIIKELNLRETIPLVIQVACFKSQKAPLDFVAMANEVIRKTSNVHFLMIGDGELRLAVENKINQLRLTPYVTLLGWRRDIPDLLALSDIFVLSSLWEGLPRVLIEARLSGLPIVTTDIEGADEMVENEKTGFIVPKKDYLALADKVLYLLQNPSIAREMGSAARAVSIEFDIDEMVRQQEKLYLKLVAKDK